MKISYNWLKDYIDFDLSPSELGDILTMIGLEVEGMEEFETVRGGMEGCFIGLVKTCKKHPNADKLTVTRVDIGGTAANGGKGELLRKGGYLTG